MIFTLTDREYNTIDAYETDDYLIGNYVGSVIKTLDINVLVKSTYAENWNFGNYIMCEDATGYKYWFTIYDVEDSYNGDEKRLTCYSGSIDIVSEDANPVKRPSEPQPFTYYFNRIFNDTGITIGVNEISGLSRVLEYTSENASNAEMLQYVLNGFDAEADLAVEFNGSTPTSLVLNVFRRIGKEEPQTTLTDEDDSLTDLDRTGSISDLATCLNPVGQMEEGEESLTLAGKYYEERDENGELLYYSPKNDFRVYSLRARQQFYVQLPSKANGEFDGYINRRYQSQASTQDSLWAESLKQLKKIDHPTIAYEAKGNIDCQIGDNIQIISNEMRPAVMISARVLEYKFNDDDSSRNEYKFGNYQELESNIDELSKMMAEIKKSIIFIKSQMVEYVISNQGDIPPIMGWLAEKPPMNVGDWLWVRTTTRLSNDDSAIAYTVSHAGNDGEKGEHGTDGETSYLHVAYANSSDGVLGFSITDSINKLYIGQYTDFKETSSNIPSMYKWTLFKGDKGEPGEQGPPGNNGSPGEIGQNAITGYLTNESLIVPANSSGVVSSYLTATGFFRVMDGNTQAMSGISYSLVSSSGCTTSISTGGYYAVTAMSADFGTATYQATYKGVTIQKIMMIVKNKQGPSGIPGMPGPQGPPTGITEQAIEPSISDRYVGMLWKKTTDGITRRWNGSNWEIFIMSVENLSVSNLAAISANLGTVTAGKIQGSGVNGKVTIDATTGIISTEASDDFLTSKFDAFGGRIKSTRIRKGINDYTVGSFDGYQIGLEAFTPTGELYQSSFIQPGGFINYAEGSTRIIEFTKEGISFSPSLKNTGNNLNSGIELMGNITYIDFHDSPTSSKDYGARIVFPQSGKCLDLINPEDNIRIRTLGHLYVMDKDGVGYREVRASRLNPQSAHSIKKDFESISTEELLSAVNSTDIVKYHMDYENDDDKKSIGFIINDDGKSPYHTSDLVVAGDGSSFDLTTTTGVLFGAIKELTKKIKQLEELL